MVQLQHMATVIAAMTLIAVTAGCTKRSPDPGTSATPMPSATRSTQAAIAIAQGTSAPAGFFYAITMTGFAANADVSVTCHDSVDPGGFKTFTLHTDATGAAAAQDKCYSGDGPEHWVSAGSTSSPRITWAVPASSIARITSSPRRNATLSLDKGPPAQFGYFYAITLRGFAANADVSVTCHDTVDANGFKTFTVHTDSAGLATTESKCYSGDGPEHWVTAAGVRSNTVSWASNSTPDGTVQLAQGAAAPFGFFYTITLRGFAANADVSATCHDTVDANGFKTFTVHTDSAGSAFAQDKCYSGDGPEHWATAGGKTSNRLTW